MKEYTQGQDQQTRKAPLSLLLLTKETMSSQDWRDARYHGAVAAGVSRREAWRNMQHSPHWVYIQPIWVEDGGMWWVSNPRLGWHIVTLTNNES